MQLFGIMKIKKNIIINMTAIDFLPKQITPLQVKIKAKQIKEKQKVVKVSTLSKEKLEYIQERVTLSSHCI